MKLGIRITNEKTEVFNAETGEPLDDITEATFEHSAADYHHRVLTLKVLVDPTAGPPTAINRPV